MKKLIRILLLIGIAAALCVSAGCSCNSCNPESKHKITFYSSGKAVAEIESNGNETITFPDAPSKEGYVFDGWYYDDGAWESEMLVDDYLTRAIESDLSVYAKFVLKASTEGIAYELVGDKYMVTGYNGSGGEVEVPAHYNGTRVSTVGAQAFYQNGSITKVTLPSSVTAINLQAFSGCKALKTVKLSNKTEYINTAAFSNCTALESINLPDNLVNLGARAFTGCIRLPMENIGDSKYYDGWLIRVAPETEVVGIRENTVGIAGEAFADNQLMTSVDIPASVRSVSERAFADCVALRSVKFYGSYIGYQAFFNCTSLDSIIIPETVTRVELDAFKGCTNITVFAEAKSRPHGWSTDWRGESGSVIWYSDTASEENDRWHYVDGLPVIW